MGNLETFFFNTISGLYLLEYWFFPVVTILAWLSLTDNRKAKTITLVVMGISIGIWLDGTFTMIIAVYSITDAWWCAKMILWSVIPASLAGVICESLKFFSKKYSNSL